MQGWGLASGPLGVTEGTGPSGEQGQPHPDGLRGSASKGPRVPIQNVLGEGEGPLEYLS